MLPANGAICQEVMIALDARGHQQMLTVSVSAAGSETLELTCRDVPRSPGSI